MSTTTERRESTGIVGETLRRPIQEAVREGVREAMAEREARDREPTGERSGEDGGGGRSRYALFVLLGLGVAGFLLWRRRSGGSGGGEERRRTESIREQSKTGSPSTVGEGAAIEEASGSEEAPPEASSE